MKTPYDAPLRVAERELDEVRVAIGDALAELQQLEQSLAAIDAQMVREVALAAGDAQLASESYFMRARGQREQICARRLTVHGRVEELREQAVECYGRRSAIENAATRYRAEAEHAEAAAEQAAMDDLIAARRIGRRRRPVPSPAMTVALPVR